MPVILDQAVERLRDLQSPLEDGDSTRPRVPFPAPSPETCVCNPPAPDTPTPHGAHGDHGDRTRPRVPFPAPSPETRVCHPPAPDTPTGLTRPSPARARATTREGACATHRAIAHGDHGDHGDRTRPRVPFPAPSPETCVCNPPAPDTPTGLTRQSPARARATTREGACATHPSSSPPGITSAT